MARKKMQLTEQLNTKLIAIILLTIGFYTSIFILYGMKETRNTLQEQSDNYGYSLAKGIATSCSHALYTGDYIALQRVIETIGTSYAQISAIEVYVAHVLVAKYSSIDSVKTLKPEKKISEKGTDYTSPINMIVSNQEINLGSVRVVLLPGRFYNLFVKQMYSSFLSGLILLIVISVLLYLLLSQLIVKPITIIEEGTKIIGKGDLNYKISVGSHDEIGRLADAFNVMTHKLKISKDEIEQWNQTLESKVKERTIELEEANKRLQETQYQLVQSGKMAAIGMIGAGVAHELNNPLGGVLGYVQLMLSKFKKPEFEQEDIKTCEKYLNYVEKESQRCKGIVDNLLNFSRRSKKSFEKINIKDVVVTTISIMEYQIKRWKMNLQTHFTDEPIMIMGSADKLQQVFINFIANAHHAMPEGGDLHVTIKTREEEGSKMVDVAISDTGCGIDKENLDKIFESFFSTKENMNNLGLGLSISNQIVKEHKGRIEVVSEVNKGTTFTVILPLK